MISRLRLAEERGIALVMTLGILLVTSVMVVTVIDYSSSAGRGANRSKADQTAYALFPCHIGRLNHLDLDRREQPVHAMTDIARQQRLLVRKIIIQGAYGHPCFQRNGACGDALPSLGAPNPNKCIKNRLDSELGARLTRPFKRFGGRHVC